MYVIFSLLFLFFSPVLLAQQQELEVKLNKESFAPGDTIDLDIKLSFNNQPATIASVFLLVLGDEGEVWKKRWPILNGSVQPSLIIPDSLKPGTYRFLFAARKEFFSLAGTVKKPQGLKSIKATLLTHNKNAFDTILVLDKENKFYFKNLLFENEARLFFSSSKTDEQNLDIEITTLLDSAFRPSAPLTKLIRIGNAGNADALTIQPLDSLWLDINSLLPEVVIFNENDRTEEKLNKKYVSGMFNDLNARTFIVSNDPFAENSFDVVQYLSNRVPGMQLLQGFGGDPVFYWRNSPMQFYVDEVRTPGAMIYGIPMNHIAMIKVYPPPFFGNIGGQGGAIAIYLIKGNGALNSNRHNFTIRGYTGLMSDLSPAYPSF